jgi:hypothetical protein
MVFTPFAAGRRTCAGANFDMASDRRSVISVPTNGRMDKNCDWELRKELKKGLGSLPFVAADAGGAWRAPGAAHEPGNTFFCAVSAIQLHVVHPLYLREGKLARLGSPPRD